MKVAQNHRLIEALFKGGMSHEFGELSNGRSKVSIEARLM